jgi:SPP1 family predicted phage head-tail adaptor
MQAGRLDQRITLQKKQVTRDAYGGEVVTWLDVQTVWAEAEPWRMRDRLVARRQLGESVVSFRVRAPLDVTLDKRALFGGVAYNIIEIDATRKRKGELSFIAKGEELGPNG